MDTIPLGGLITLLVLLPNLVAILYPPLTSPAAGSPPGNRYLRAMTVVERIGQAGSFTIPFFYRLNPEGVWDGVALGVMAACLAVYYAGWVRYLLLGRGEALFYRPLLGIPLPMAVMPVVYFLAAALLLGSAWLLLAACILGGGHITVTWLNSPDNPSRARLS